MATTVYGFITDTAFFNPLSIDIVGGGFNQQVGYLTDKEINHFVKAGVLKDIREDRLALLSQVLTGKAVMLFDATKQEDTTILGEITDMQLKQLFNIAETAYLSQNRTQDELNIILGSDTVLYEIYTVNSLKMSMGSTSIGVTLDVITSVNIHDYIQFEVTLNGNAVIFKLWLGSKAFILDYPLTTIMRVVPPCDPLKLLNPSKFINSIQAVSDSKVYTSNIYKDELSKEDHTGVVTYSAKYITGSSTPYFMLFDILYKGTKPSTLEIRKAIRDYLSYIESNDAVWKEILPDLYVTAQFFLIPLWDNVTIRPNRIIYMSTIKVAKLRDTVTKFFPSLTAKEINKSTDTLNAAYSEIYTVSVPDALNEIAETFQELHPSYQNHNRQHSAFSNMEKHTQEFSDHFNSILAILAGEWINSGVYTENNFDGILWLSFVVSAVEYHVMFKKSYEEAIA